MTDKDRPIAMETRASIDQRRYSPSAGRNRDPIRNAALLHMPRSGAILEIGSGTGEHAVHLAAAFPDAIFLPGDPDAASRESIAAWIAETGLNNLRPPHALDVTQAGWTDGVGGPVDAVISCNMIHIAPLGALRGLIGGAGVLLRDGGVLFLYGPFARDGAHTAPSNAAFDLDLRRRNPEWGVRDLERQVVPLAADSGFSLQAIEPMPANNLVVVFRKDRPASP